MNTGLGLNSDHQARENVYNALHRNASNVCLGKAGLANGTNTAKLKTASAVDYAIQGVAYTKSATDDFVDFTGFDVSDGSSRACYVALDASGDDSIIIGAEASDAATAESNLNSVDVPDTKTVIGKVVLTMSGGGFTGGTTGFDDGNVDTVTITDLISPLYTYETSA